ncbi:MAG: hypothetical protein H7839_06855 [Magnetococcus sp. YQC-5]
MGKITVAETIKELSRIHIEQHNGLLMGQCISAVGWVNGTVPNVPGIIELPMTESAGSGIAVGAAMVGRRPILVIRFQDFLISNGSQLLCYAAKVKELHGKSAPVLVRALASEGIGPLHSGVLHSLFMHFPGFLVCAPMTPEEHRACWRVYMENDDPMLISEHRLSFANTEEMPDDIHDNASITLFAISSPRLYVQEASAKLAAEGIVCNIVHLVWLKPFVVDERMLKPLRATGLGLVIDASFEICGASRSIAYDLSDAAGVPVKALGLLDHTKCLCPPLRNEAPNAERIQEVVKTILCQH